MLLSHQHQPRKAKPCPTKNQCLLPSLTLSQPVLAHGCCLLSQPHSLTPHFRCCRVSRAARPCFHCLGWGVNSPCSHSNHSQPPPLFRACFWPVLSSHHCHITWHRHTGRTVWGKPTHFFWAADIKIDRSLYALTVKVKQGAKEAGKEGSYIKLSVSLNKSLFPSPSPCPHIPALNIPLPTPSTQSCLSGSGSKCRLCASTRLCSEELLPEWPVGNTTWCHSTAHRSKAQVLWNISDGSTATFTWCTQRHTSKTAWNAFRGLTSSAFLEERYDKSTVKNRPALANTTDYSFNKVSTTSEVVSVMVTTTRTKDSNMTSQVKWVLKILKAQIS